MTTNDADHVSEANAHLIAAAADIARRITGDHARAARQALETTDSSAPGRKNDHNHDWR